MVAPKLDTFRLQNFKAVRDSGVIRFTPLTVFIGNNGSGKSSVIEGLQTLQAIVDQGLDRAMQQWRGFEYIWNQRAQHRLVTRNAGRSYHTNPIRFDLRGSIRQGPFTAASQINIGPGGNELFFQHEHVEVKNVYELEHNDGQMVKGRAADGPNNLPQPFVYDQPGESILGNGLDKFISDWQFVLLNPQAMGNPVPQQRTGGKVRLASDGSNIAEYLLDIRRLDQMAFDGIIETLQYVLPYATDLQPTLTSELERAVYLRLTEGQFKVPGWLLSTGTLRILALLALLRHPTPPPLIVIEEIENGLDPRTIGLIVEEIRAAIESGQTQIILTTHSPYLLDLLDLSHIVVVERINDEPVFSRPADQESLQEWSQKFSPGRLYTMGRLSRQGQA